MLSELLFYYFYYVRLVDQNLKKNSLKNSKSKSNIILITTIIVYDLL